MDKNKGRDNVVPLAVEHALKKEEPVLSPGVAVCNFENIPPDLKDILLLQGRMIVATLTTKPLEKLQNLDRLRLKGFTAKDARAHVLVLLNEMRVAVSE